MGAGAEVKRVAGVETLLLALRPHTNYTVQALAYTAAGDGVPAHPIHCTTQQDGKIFDLPFPMFNRFRSLMQSDVAKL